MNARRTVLLAAVGVTLGVLVTAGSGAARQAGTPGFAAPVYVDQELAGGEPLVVADTLHGKLVYTAHEGTTHLYRDGLTLSPWGNFSFVSNYCNQVNVWNSTDGINWFRARYLGSPCPTSPLINTGFSDPDLTFDASGRLYNTGINLVNDALFSSADGGTTWDKGTAQCHDGDRPWLAGGKADQVFLATNTAVDGHAIFESTDGGNSCGLTGITGSGRTPDGASWTGNGKLYYVPATKGLIEPIIFSGPSGKFGLGISTWEPGQAATTPHRGVDSTTMFSHWAAIAIDRGGVTYMVWDTDDRQAGTDGGCNGASPAPNSIKLVYSRDRGKSWSKVLTVAAPKNARVFWPWIAAGDKGKVSVVWYQTGPGQLPDLDCQPGDVYVYEASILDTLGSKPHITPVNVIGRPVHTGQVCQGGTTCVATGQDRRLGDFFTNALDARGCVLIATGDTKLLDPTTGGPYPTARPLFVRQVSGSALYGSKNCS